MSDFDSFCLTPQAPTVEQQKKQVPALGLPVGDTKSRSIAELQHDEVVKLIEVAGVRVVWSRSLVCPCKPCNAETDQPDPSCTLCKGRGFLYFGPETSQLDSEVGTLTEIQKAILGDVQSGQAAVIKTLFQRATNERNPYDVVGDWNRGGMFATVRWQNLLGYYDRLVNIDSVIVFDEHLEQPALDRVTGLPVRTVPLRYRATSVTVVIDQNGVRYHEGADFERTAAGKVIWVGAVPAPGVRYSVHYCTHPTWLVVEHPHVIRETPRRKNQKEKLTPIGNPQPQPIQARVQLEFIPKTSEQT